MGDDDTNVAKARLEGETWRVQQVLRLYSKGEIDVSRVKTELAELDKVGGEYADRIVNMTDAEIVEYAQSLAND